MRKSFLSHYIDQKTPLYGGDKSISISFRSKISLGDSSNTTQLQFPNHIGTHVDFPYHFSDDGKNINDYPAHFWIFKKVSIVEYQAAHNEIINSLQTTVFENLDINTELLMIKTNFQRFRGSKTYWNNNPGLSPSLALFLKERYPNLRAIGFDFISASSFQNRKLGREAHMSFLIDQDILLIEDMDLSTVQNNIFRITCLPLLINDIDGSPIIVLAEYD